MEKQIQALAGHYIICGFGRIGSLICKEFKANGLKFVIIEKSQEAAERLEDDDYLYMKGDATLDETLIKAGISRAKGLISVVTSDTENVYITLTARGLNPDLYIMSRSGEEGSDIKLKRAGANKVVSPYTIGGNRMAQSILRPNVVDFIEIATGHEHLELQMEEIHIPAHSAFVGETLVTSGFRKEIGVIIVGIKNGHGTMVFNPHSQTKIDEDDTLIVLGDPNAIHKLEDLVARTAADEVIKEHRKAYHEK